MAIIAKFYIGDKAYNVLQAGYEFSQRSDETGRPTNYRSAFKGLTMMIESTHDNYFFDMATHPTKKDQGKLVFTDAIPGGRSRTLYFADFVVIGHKTGFTANDNNSMTETVSISAGGIKDSVSGTAYSNHW
ncbi:type VI secretion system tube protein TssD [Aquimarina sediminis]|uniref:type VI secretion system tube protein TssD n=1 Tax=Aquimarina sediminis TaxID=2070536 RepID=UPI000CA078C6|nr:type VI secretion system tube protein TssD [Aquimarina sediminis]